MRATSPACVARCAPSTGRGFDDLPADVLAGFGGALVRSLDRDELLRALRVAVDGLLREGADVEELRGAAAKIEPRLRALVSA